MKAEIAVAERRLDDILTQIRGAAGQSSPDQEAYDEWDGGGDGSPDDQVDEEVEEARA